MGNTCGSPENFITSCDLQQIQCHTQDILCSSQFNRSKEVNESNESNESNKPNESKRHVPFGESADYDFFYEAACYACSSKRLPEQKIQCILSIFHNAGLSLDERNPNVHDWSYLHYTCAAHNYFLLPFFLHTCRLNPYVRDEYGLLPIDFIPRYHYHNAQVQLLLVETERYKRQALYQLQIVSPLQMKKLSMKSIEATLETKTKRETEAENEKEQPQEPSPKISKMRLNDNPSKETEEKGLSNQIREKMISNDGIHHDSLERKEVTMKKKDPAFSLPDETDLGEGENQNEEEENHKENHKENGGSAREKKIVEKEEEDNKEDLTSTVYAPGDIVYLKYERPEDAPCEGYIQVLFWLETESFLDVPHFGPVFSLVRMKKEEGKQMKGTKESKESKEAKEAKEAKGMIAFPTIDLPDSCFCQFLYIISDNQFVKRRVIASAGPILLQPNFHSYGFKVNNELFYTKKYSKLQEKEFMDTDELKEFMKENYYQMKENDMEENEENQEEEGMDNQAEEEEEAEAQEKGKEEENPSNREIERQKIQQLLQSNIYGLEKEETEEGMERDS